ncbi:MAG: rhodanese-like domain-containing protein [Anaerolineae bacterium]|nr:rhodanese-like domain-containing protein [Anaerolineae bacterium]
MRKLSYLILVLALVLPLALPFAPALAQEGSAVQARLEEYDANLPAGFGLVSVQDLGAELVDNPNIVLVDVRQPEEYEPGHIMGALNIPLRDLAKNLALLPDTSAKIVVICGTGFRSAIGMTALQILGYTDVRSMSGGMAAWEAEEFAVTAEPFVVEAGTAPEFDADVLAAVDAALSGIPQGWGAIKAEDLNVALIDEQPILVDVRTPDERATGYIAGAIHMPLGGFMSMAGELPEDKAANIVVYCKGGHRGNMAATMLRTLGYTNVRNLSGGITGWTTAGLPIEGASEAPAAAESGLAGLLDAYIVNLPASFNAVRANDLAAELVENPDLLLVDVRTPDEFVEGHLVGAINIPLVELTDHLDMLPNLDQDMVIYCGSGHRSAMAMAVLNLLGYTNARSMLGGVRAWTTAELPVTTDEIPYEGAGAAPAFDAAVFEAVDAYLKAIPAGYYAISADDLNIALIENAPYLIDVRTDGEVAQGFIESAAHIELRSFVARMAEWPEDKAAPIVIYCGSDHRAVIAMVAMQMMGYTDVRTLAGGLQAWLAKEYPVVTPS